MSTSESLIKPSFESLYIAARQKECRVYSDDEVLALPAISKIHVHYNEWQIRKRSVERLAKHIRNKKRPLKILEVGCGNGWLSASIAALPGVDVVGIDVNLPELDQAKRVFDGRGNLQFVFGDISQSNLPHDKFDVIVFAASIQYFASLKNIIGNAVKLLNKNGEIHIIDSHFYSDENVGEAITRSKKYYEGIGFKALSDFYFHHTYSALKKFSFKLISNPHSILNKLTGKYIFPWIIITQ